MLTGHQSAVITVFYERTMHFTCKKRAPAPPAKADCVSASGKTRPFAPTVRADFESWRASNFFFAFDRLFPDESLQFKAVSNTFS